MAIPESQLETWAHQGAVASSKATHESIRAALTAPTSPIRQRVAAGEVDIYLQGSYKNDTNIRGDSDVDVVVELTANFYSNLTESEKQSLGLTAATYSWSQFRADVASALQRYYRPQVVDNTGNKSIKIRPDSGRLGADVVPCAQYRTYRNLGITAEGITFWTQPENRQVINFPKLHYANGVNKHSAQQTNGWYKPTVRIFKNARTYLEEQGLISVGLAPSYFLECLLSNVPDACFGNSLEDTFVGVFNWLWGKAQIDGLVCQNGLLALFGNTPEQWDVSKARQFLGALRELWENW